VPRGLDHIVHAVHDLDAAVALYGRLGFQVGARNRHPPEWGTQNHIVQFPGTFVELLSVEDETYIAPHTVRAFSFGAFNRDFLARGQGLSMLVLEGYGAADLDVFRTAGIGDFEPYEFEREGKRPNGAPIKVAFALAFARDPKAPDVGFFTCQHRHPENFWNPAFQSHPNTAAAVTGVVLVAENPSDHHIFLSLFAGEREVLADSSGITLKTTRGEIQVMNPAAFGEHFDMRPPNVARGARLAALRFGVRDLGRTAAVWRAAGLPVLSHKSGIALGPSSAMGATLVFEPVNPSG
jgi:hypothetical protein